MVLCHCQCVCVCVCAQCIANKITTSRTLDRLNGMRFVGYFFFSYSIALGCRDATKQRRSRHFLHSSFTFLFRRSKLVRRLRSSNFICLKPLAIVKRSFYSSRKTYRVSMIFKSKEMDKLLSHQLCRIALRFACIGSPMKASHRIPATNTSIT